MADQLSLRGGTTTEHSTFTGANKEVTVDTTKKTLVVHDGATVGGHPIMRENGSNSALALGSAGTPSLKFSGDTNTGIYSPGADQVAISTNGTGRLFVDASGNVGVGAASSGDRLEITGNATIANASAVLKVNGTSGSPQLLFQRSGTNSSQLTDVGASGLLLQTIGGNPLLFGTNATERMRLDSSGRLGIGVTGPAETLSVSGNAVIGGLASSPYGWSAGSAYTGVQLAGNFSTKRPALVVYHRFASNGEAGQILFKGESTSGNVKDLAAIRVEQTATEVNAASGNIVFLRGTGNALSEAARIDSSGRLLVGTSSYSGNSKFVVAGLVGGDVGLLDLRYTGSRPTGADITVSEIRFGSADLTANSAYARIIAESDGASSSASDIPGRLVFSTCPDSSATPVERMRITQAGFTKATSTGSYYGATGEYHEFRTNKNLPTIYGTNTATSGNVYGYQMYFTGASPNDTTSYFFNGEDSTAVRVTLRSNGGIANYSANNVNLSDRNAKKDIVPAADTWDCLKQWEIVNFRYKDQPDDADLNMGVIAQQVSESCPEVITVFQEATEDQPEKLGVKDQQMMWMAIKALQEAMERIETLEAKVAALEAA